MRVGEFSSETRKYLDPVTVLLEMFPTSKRCDQCRTMIHLDNVRDTYHVKSGGEWSVNQICWNCPICKRQHYFTEDQQLVEAHNALIPSDALRFEKRMQRVSITVLSLIVLTSIALPLWATLF